LSVFPWSQPRKLTRTRKTRVLSHQHLTKAVANKAPEALPRVAAALPSLARALINPVKVGRLAQPHLEPAVWAAAEVRPPARTVTNPAERPAPALQAADPPGSRVDSLQKAAPLIPKIHPKDGHFAIPALTPILNPKVVHFNLAKAPQAAPAQVDLRQRAAPAVTLARARPLAQLPGPAAAAARVPQAFLAADHLPAAHPAVVLALPVLPLPAAADPRLQVRAAQQDRSQTPARRAV